VAVWPLLLLESACGISKAEQQMDNNNHNQEVVQHIVRRPELKLDTTQVRDGVPTDSLPPLRNAEDELFSSSTLIIHYDSVIGKEPLLKAIEQYGAEIIYDYRIINAVAIRIPDGTDIHTAIDHFNQVDGVLSVNRDRKMQLMNEGPSRLPRR